MTKNVSNELTIKELKELEKKSRHIIYNKYKEPLTNVLRYNSMGVVLPKHIENYIRSILKDIRNNEIVTDIIDTYYDKYQTHIIGHKTRKGRIFSINGREYFSIQTSGDTYRHTGIQGIELFKGGKKSLKNGDIDEKQHINDILRDERHDLSEYITDDKPRFEKTDEYRQWEKDIEHEIISTENYETNNLGKLTEKEKSHLVNILNYNDDSRFKIYEHLLFIKDAIEMKNNADKYNETLSVIYEILKWSIGKINNGKIKLDNGDTRDILDFQGIKDFLRNNEDDIDDLFIYLKNNSDKLSNEFRFTKNGYSINDLKDNFDEFKKDWLEIKVKLAK